MKEINIGKIIMLKRREIGITQEELAAVMGVSKASVSKWETGQSYPDITLLPHLSSYFNISIDELMGYSPQLTPEVIKTFYHQRADDFGRQPFEEVVSACRQEIKKYYSCFPFLLQMSILFINHHMLAANPEDGKELLREAVTLCQRVKNESDDLNLSRSAVSVEATAYLMLNEPAEVMDLVGETVRPFPQDTEMLAQAYQMAGNPQKAREVLQISMYQHLLFVVGSAVSYLMLNAADQDRIAVILERTLGVAELFELEALHPNTMAQLYYGAAQVYATNRHPDKALDFLTRYTHLCITGFFPFSLHGDAYFDAIQPWLTELELGGVAPRSDGIIKKSMLEAIQANPVFAPLHEDPRYKNLIIQFESYLQE
jgi:transcriptional regulator with XRE-family HTH domain